MLTSNQLDQDESQTINESLIAATRRESNHPGNLKHTGIEPNTVSTDIQGSYMIDQWLKDFRELLGIRQGEGDSLTEDLSEKASDRSIVVRNILIQPQPLTDSLQQIVTQGPSTKPQRESEATRMRKTAMMDWLTKTDPNQSFLPTSPTGLESLSNCYYSSDPTISVLPRLDLIKRSSFGPLITNSSWIGKQRSGTKSYDVQVQIIHLDLDSGLGSGLLKIFGLTNDLPTMMTFFDIEIIGNKHNFLTQAWGSTEPADSEHWSKFGPFKDYLNQLRSSGLQTEVDFEDPESRKRIMLSSEVRGLEKWWSNQPFLFMRWKEKFLVGDYASEDTNGASFAGFYYVCIELPAVRIEQPDCQANDKLTSRNSKIASMRKSVDQTSTRSLRSHARSNTMTFRRSSTGSDSYASVVRRSSSTGNSPSLSSPPVSSGNGRGRSVRTLLSSLNSSLEPSRSPTTIEFDDDDEEKEVFPSPSSTSHEFPDELLEGSDDRSRGRGRPNRDIYMDEEKTQMYGDGDVRQIEEEKSQRVDQTTRLCEGCFEDHCLDLADFKKRSQKACQTGNFVRGGNFFDGSCLEMNQFGLPDAIIKGFYYHTESEPNQELILRPELRRPLRSRKNQNDKKEDFKKDKIKDDCDCDRDDWVRIDGGCSGKAGFSFGTYQIC